MPQKELEIDFQKYWLVLKRHWLLALAVCGLTTAAAAFLGSTQALLYKAEGKLLFESSKPVTAIVGLDTGEGNLTPLTSQSNPLDTQVEIFLSKPIAEKVINQLKIEDSEGAPLEANALLQDMSVRAIPGTDVLAVSYESTSPALAQAVVNAMMAAFIQANVQANRTAAIAAQSFVASQLPASKAKVGKIESDLRAFKEANGIVNLEEESQNTVKTLSTVTDSITQLRSDLADKNAQFAQIQQQLRLNPQEAYAVGLVSESPGVQEVITTLQAVQSQLAIALTRYREGHPEIASLRSQEVALLTLLQTRVGLALGSDQIALPDDDLQAGELEQSLILSFLQLDAERAGLQQRLNQLTSAQAAQQSRAQLLPGLEKRNRELERELDAAQTTYETLLASRQQAQVLEKQDVGNARTISLADLPEESISPALKLYLLAGGVVGALLGIAIAFLADLLETSVKTVTEGQKLYDYPLLGVIPDWRKRTARNRELDAPRIIVKQRHRVPLVESYQSLQANLKFSYFDGSLKAITVTSAVGGEGKSEISANLALTLAQLGHSVLLIDADMRSPIQHHIWDISNLKGLSNLVAGQLPLKQAIVRQEPNLHLLPAGSIPPNPLAIIESKRMASMLEVFKQTYDYIIIDSPPLLGLADTLTLGRISDGVLLAMRPGVVDSGSIRAVKQLLGQSQSKQRILGIVANGIDDRNGPERYFYHSQEYVADTQWQNAEDLEAANRYQKDSSAETRVKVEAHGGDNDLR
ncbi:MAG: lipopolysaccharide biosynthesis protein [Leptolyngbya foveolarum]|uniref:non-specific protein-tyrosine kinase n=1 Tax=Leptolyngbya foveolarum TaxID=47253 RepID=A0A2W4UY24_9CYAN|nr:MAG: lipopolysaccharide biosynthesis protein [Leptolyngbya foveolarum]